MTDVEFRQMLVEWMEREDLSDDDVAVQLDMSVPTVRRWKEGVTAPSRYIKNFVKKQIEHAD